MYHARPHHLRLPFEDEYAHLVWSADFGLANISVVAVPTTPRHGRGTIRATTKRAKLSPWLTEDETSDSFCPLQLDVFHAAHGDNHGEDATPRPAGPPTRGAREVESREHPLRLFPAGAQAGLEFVDNEGQPKVFKATVFDYSDPYWRVEYMCMPLP